MNFAAIKFPKVKPEIAAKFPNVTSSDGQKQLCVVPVDQLKNPKARSEAFKPQRSSDFDKKALYRFTGLGTDKYPRVFILYLGGSEEEVRELINGSRPRCPKVFDSDFGPRTTDEEQLPCTSQKERRAGGKFQNVKALLSSHGSLLKNTLRRADNARTKRIRSASKSPTPKSPERKRSNSEERLQRLQQMQLQQMQSEVPAIDVKQLYENLQQLELERQIEKEEMHRERCEFFRLQSELLIQQQEILKKHEEERDSWKTVQQRLIDVLGSFKEREHQTGGWLGMSPSPQGSQRQPTWARIQHSAAKSPFTMRQQSPVASSSSNSETEFDRCMSQEGGQFRIDLGAVGRSGERLFCHSPAYDSAQRAKDGKDWCRLMMKGIYGDSAKYYRVGKPRKEGLKQIPDSHFQLIEGHYLSYMENVKGVPKDSPMYNDMKRGLPERLGNVGDTLLRTEKKHEKRRLNNSKNTTGASTADSSSKNTTGASTAEGEDDVDPDDVESLVVNEHIREDMGGHVYRPNLEGVEISETEVANCGSDEDDVFRPRTSTQRSRNQVLSDSETNFSGSDTE